MRIALGSILLMIVVAGNAQPSPGNDAQHARILALENAWNQAIQEKDMQALDALLDNDLIFIDYEGRVMNKAEYMASVKEVSLRFEHVTNDSMQVQIYGKSAVVVGIYHEKGLRKGKPYSYRERFVDTWLNLNGAWLCVASQSTLILR
jgi:ketosteroid isomerase-like protein